jgi:membrane protein
MLQRVKKIIARTLNIAWIRFWVDVFRRFGNNNGSLNAAGLAFFMLLSFIPMILAGVAILSLVIPPASAIHEVRIMVDNLLPVGGAREEMKHFLGDRLAKTLDTLSQRGGVASVLGLVTTVWASMQIFVTGSTAMNLAYEVRERRGWFKLRLVALALLAVSGVILLVSLVLSGAPSALRGDFIETIDHSNLPPIVVSVVFELIATVLNALLFTIVYKYLPSVRNSWRSAFFGGLAAGILFETAKKGIAVYLLRPSVSIYGQLANLIVFILWIYYSMIILLLGCEVAAAYSRDNEPHVIGTAGRARQKTIGERIQRTARAVLPSGARSQQKGPPSVPP